MGEVYLVDLLDKAEIECPSPEYVSVERVTIYREPHTVIFAHPQAEIQFPLIEINADSHLEFGIGVKPTAWERIQSEIVFQVALMKPLGRSSIIFQETLDPAKKIEHRTFQFRSMDLRDYARKPIRLEFRTLLPGGGDPSYAWSFWSDPRVTHASLKTHRKGPSKTGELIFLITADALRADHLGCYGHPEINTPHIDRLAEDGWLFEHARTQSPATNAAYASILTGQYPTKHGVLTEWGSMKYDETSLPQVLSQAGYHTILAASEAELTNPYLGLTQRFQELIPVVGNPMQDGAITLRRFYSRLESDPPSHGFIWLQFFDTHPPSAVPEPFRSMYYDGDPTDPARINQPELIAEIRGMECVLDIRRALPRLEAGFPEIGLGMRLRDTGAMLQGVEMSPPDLAPHLAAFPAEARSGKSREEFGRQLVIWGEELFDGFIPEDLLPWLKEILPRLEVIEAEILTWLDGVVDYDYALRQYWAQVSYFDHLIGNLVSYLQEHDLYDQSTIVLTSPHGELMGEQGVRFHHHTLQEGILRVPLIIKPNLTTESTQGLPAHGRRISGVFEHIDIFPTILEMRGIEPPPGLPGQSRLEEIRLGQIHDHDSFTVGNLGLCTSLTRGDIKLIWALEDLWNSPEWSFQGGERRLIDLTITDPDSRDVTNQEPEIAENLAAQLGQWMQQQGLTGSG